MSRKRRAKRIRNEKKERKKEKKKERKNEKGITSRTTDAFSSELPAYLSFNRLLNGILSYS